jgi:hypothetical protein
MAIIHMEAEKAKKRLYPNKHRDGEEFYDNDWNVVKPENCLLDYHLTLANMSDWYGEIFDVCTGTLIARTRYFKLETDAERGAEKIISHLKKHYHFEENMQE